MNRETLLLIRTESFSLQMLLEHMGLFKGFIESLNRNLRHSYLKQMRTVLFVSDALMVSRPGTIAPDTFRIRENGEEIIVISLYSTWSYPMKQTGSRWLYADASAHRLISDLSGLIGQQKNHKIIAAGDLNILYGYGENGSFYWKWCYDTVFDRMSALGLRFIGPQAPDGGEQAFPWPAELPGGSCNVPTFRTHKSKPETATRQLDFVFASESIADRLSVRAANSIEECGPSDHCRVFVELEYLL